MGNRVERPSGAAPPLFPMMPVTDQPAQPVLEIRASGDAGGPRVVEFAGELDLSTVPRATQELHEALDRGDPVIADLTRLSFIDSSGIAVLVEAVRSMDGAGPAMGVVVATGSQVQRVFSLAGIDRLLAIFPDRDAALARLGNGAG
jgi:anti-sigma B factor antagonist